MRTVPEHGTYCGMSYGMHGSGSTINKNGGN
jgi:hypothetical protein